MADQEHIQQLGQGIDSWNRWRGENKEIQPDLSEIDLSKVNLHGADLSVTHLSKANLSKANLRDANLIGLDLSEANLSETDLTGADLTGVGLSSANLSGANLSRADLFDADLSEADLSDAKLGYANLGEVDLTGANLSEANLTFTCLVGANLSRANLSHADLSYADLSEANLSETNLSEAALGGTTIAKTDLRTIKGLTSIRHEGPSHLELFSVQLPQDGSALRFLQGVGVPDEWINFWRTTMMHPIQYYSCFISYTNKDELLATRLHADLQANGVRCWFAPEDMKIGDRIHQRIDEAIHLQDKLLLVLSEYSIASEWVQNEVEAAIEKEQRQQRDVLLPVRLDSAVIETTQAWAATLRRTRHIGDFSQWREPEAYQSAFTRLLRDLKQG